MGFKLELKLQHPKSHSTSNLGNSKNPTENYMLKLFEVVDS